MNRQALEPVVDLGRAREFLGDDHLLQQVAQAYAASSRHCYGELSRAIAAGDPNAVRRSLHRLLPIVRLAGSAELLRQGEQLQAAWQAGGAVCDGKEFLRNLRQFNRTLCGAHAPGSRRGHAGTDPRH